MPDFLLAGLPDLDLLLEDDLDLLLAADLADLAESESESTTNKAVIRPTATRQRSQQQLTPTNLIGEITTGRQSKNQKTTAVRPTSWQKITPSYSTRSLNTAQNAQAYI